MKRKYIFPLTALALAFLLLALPGVTCKHGDGQKPPVPPVPPTPPPGEQRVSTEAYRARRIWVADHVHSPYLEVRKAMDILRGGHVDLNGVKISFWEWALVWYAYVNGDESVKDQARNYCRQYLRCESGQTGPPCGYGRDDGFLGSGTNCSMNHQARRWGSINACVEILTEAEALRYGNADKVRNAKRNWLDVIVGRGWRDPYGNPITEGPCATSANAGDHTETYSSRHYMGRTLTYLMATAQLSKDPELRAAAYDALDRARAHMSTGVRTDRVAILDPARLSENRANTGTRCPQYPCKEALRKYSLECGPGESPAIVAVLFADTTWPQEFGGTEACQDADQFYLYGWWLFNTWRPLLNTKTAEWKPWVPPANELPKAELASFWHPAGPRYSPSVPLTNEDVLARVPRRN